MSRATSIAVLIALGATLGAALAVRAEVPAAEDFATCNAKAADETKKAAATALREMRDGVKIENEGTDQAKVVKEPIPPAVLATMQARQEYIDRIPESVDVNVDVEGKTVTQARDPQVEGMAADRANDPRYVAAYRSCMRQRGF